jgi:hypothetical protein
MRTRVLKEVDLYLHDLKEEMNRLVLEHNDSAMFRLGEVDATIRGKLSEVWDMLDNLRSEKCLKTLITFHATNFTQALEEDFKSIEEHLRSINDRKLKLTIDSKQLRAMRECLSRLIRLKSVKEQDDDPGFRRV